MTLFANRFRVESNRLPDWDYADHGWYFVTLCAYGQRDIFGTVGSRGVRLSLLGNETKAQWVNIPSHYQHVRLDDFVVMPNHLHGIVILEHHHRFTPDRAPGPGAKKRTFRSPKAGSLGAIIRSFKAGVSRAAGLNRLEVRVWQANYYEHIIRNQRSLNAIREYMRLNPQNWREEGKRWRAKYRDVASYVSTTHWKVLYNL